MKSPDKLNKLGLAYSNLHLMVKLMQGRTIGTGSFREDDIEDDIDFRVALRGVLASTG